MLSHGGATIINAKCRSGRLGLHSFVIRNYTSGGKPDHLLYTQYCSLCILNYQLMLTMLFRKKTS